MTTPASSDSRGRQRGRMTLREHPEAGAFLREFQERHLSEVEFLLQQRRRLLVAPAGSWLDAEELELRLARHLEAMSASRAVAVDCAHELLTTGDAWQLRAALHTLAALAPELVDIDRLLQSREEDLTHVLLVWAEALALAENPAIADCCARALYDKRPQVRAAAASLLGYRREVASSKLIDLLADEDASVRGEAALALARLRHRPALAPIESLLPHEAGGTVEPLARAALMLGSNLALAICRQHCAEGQASPSLLRVLGLAGDSQSLPVLRQACKTPELTEAALGAMGLLGLRTAVAELLSQLESEAEPSSRAAARALGLLTGADLKQKARGAVPDEVEIEDESPEVEQWSRDPESWQRWWAAHEARFRDGVRWRHGRPFTLEGCLEELKGAQTPPDTRARAALELALQSRKSFDFEHDWPVLRQRQSLAAWRPPG